MASVDDGAGTDGTVDHRDASCRRYVVNQKGKCRPVKLSRPSSSMPQAQYMSWCRSQTCRNWRQQWISELPLRNERERSR